MQPTFTDIKKTAKTALSSRWTEAIFVLGALASVVLLNLISQSVLMQIFKVDAVWSPFFPADLPEISVIASICITLFSALYSLFITCPFLFGVFKWFWSVTNESNAQIEDLFYFFSNGRLFRKAICIGINIYLRIVVTAVICFIPYVICNILQSPEFYQLLGVDVPVIASILFPLVYFLRFIGAVAVLVLTIKYLLFPVVLFTKPELSASKTVTVAAKLARRESLRLLGFLCSFLGWLLLSVLVIPIIYTGPYILSSISIYGREVLREHEQRLEE